MRFLFLAFLLVGLTASPASAEEGLRIHMLSGSAEYKSEESLKLWAQHLEKKLTARTTFSLGTDRSKTVSALECIEQADVLVVFCRRWELEEKQAALITNSIKSGKPVLGIRTASHAFEFFKEFDHDVLGGDYQGHGSGGEEMEVFPCSENLDHPVLNGISAWKRTGKVYRNPNLAKDVSVLLSAQSVDVDAPLAWVRLRGQQRIFYTSMGFPEDFQNPSFLRLLDNALSWVVGKP